MGTHDAKLFSQYPKDYVGKGSFEDFVSIFLNQIVVEKWKKKLHLVGRNELHERYSLFCEKFHLPRASNVNIGRHLGHFGIKCDTKIGPAGAQVRFYSGLSWVEGVGSQTKKKSLEKRVRKERKKKDNQIVQAHPKMQKNEERPPEAEETAVQPETEPEVLETEPVEEKIMETEPGVEKVMEIKPDVQETVMETEPDVQERQPMAEEEVYFHNFATMPFDDLEDYCAQVLDGLLECGEKEKEESEFGWDGFYPFDC